MVDDEICGYEDTASGNPCKNSADSCPWHNTDNPPDTGRPDKFTDDRAADAIEAARNGFSKAGCARAAGVTPQTINNWLDRNPDYKDGKFFEAFMRARHKGERQLVTGPLYDDADEQHKRTVNGQHARFLLSTSFDYIKTERTELTGEDGGAIEVESDVVTVTEATED